jgi:integrase
MAAFLHDALVTHAGQLGLAENYVLCRTSKGTLFRRDYYNREIWKPAIAAVGRLADTTFHDLRHTFASTALAEGVPISEVSRWLGHKSITTTVDLYGHLVPEAGRPGPRCTRPGIHPAVMCSQSAPGAYRVGLRSRPER